MLRTDISAYIFLLNSKFSLSLYVIPSHRFVKISDFYAQCKYK